MRTNKRKDLASLSLAAALVTGCLFSVSMADELFVWQDSETPSAPYATWETAAHHIQDAVDTAGDNDVVIVRAGTYTLPPNPTNYYGDNVVYINKPLTLRSENGDYNDVIIDGEEIYRPIAVVYTNTVNTAPYQAGDDPFIFDGLTITNGYGISRGGGILLYHKRRAWPAVINNCLVAGNRVVYGLKQEVGESAHLDNGSWGGGICSYTYSDYSKLYVSNSIIAGNRAVESAAEKDAFGGGLYIRGRDITHIYNSRFFDNGSYNGGGAYFAQSDAGMLLVERCEFIGNNSTAGASSGGGGGGIYTQIPDALFRNCLIRDNTTGNFGGGIGTFQQNATIDIVNCTIVNNIGIQGYRGAGIGVRFTAVGTGAGVNLYNSVLVNNKRANGTIENFFMELGTNTAAASAALSTFHHNLTTVLQGGAEFSGEGNITEAPTFVDAEANNYRLTPDSRGVNEGLNLDPALQGAHDLDGHRRIDGLFKTVDIGCYEYMPSGLILMVR